MKISKKTQDILVIIGLVVLPILSVMAWHWTDTAKKPFWWNFWIVAGLIAIAGFIGLVYWKGQQKDTEERLKREREQRAKDPANNSTR